MNAIAGLREKRTASVLRMRALVDVAEREQRDLSDAERGEFDGLKAEIATLETRIGRAEAIAEAERTMVGAVPVAGSGGGRQRSWGEQAVSAPELRTFAAGGYRGTCRIGVQGHEMRAVQNLGTVVQPDRRPGITGLPRQRLVVRDLLPQAPTTSSSIEVVRETSFTNAAATVAEATGGAGVGVKPESDLGFGLYTAPTRVIAHFVTASRQAVDDLPQLQQFIDGRLRWGLAYREELQILSGNGVAPNLQGLVGVAAGYDSARNQTGDTRVDVVHHAIAQLADAGIAASGIVLNLADFSRMLELKDSNGNYIGEGPFGATDQNRLWNLPVAATPALAAGSFLVGDFLEAATIYDRMQPEVLISTEHSDYFIRNLVAIRGEERIALAITTPTAMLTGTFGAITA